MNEKEKLLEIMNKLKEIEDKVDYNLFETAVYTYMRYGIQDVETATNEQVSNLIETVNSLSDLSSIFNSNINEETESILLPF